MRWHLSIFTTDGKTLLFAAKCADYRECAALAAEARALRADAQIFLRAPTGEVTSWT